jgi:hypothetical protein
MVNAINLSLRRNRKILKDMLNGSCELLEVDRHMMVAYGFDFMYYTHTRHINCKTYLICYDFGYIPITPQKVLIAHIKNLPEPKA